MSDPLFLLPPGSPEPPSPPLPPTALPPPSLGPARPFYRPLPRGLTDLPQREIDGIRIHFYLLFYDEHALLWSGLEQHFAEMDEKRFNRALAWLEEVVSVATWVLYIRVLAGIECRPWHSISAYSTRTQSKLSLPQLPTPSPHPTHSSPYFPTSNSPRQHVNLLSYHCHGPVHMFILPVSRIPLEEA